MEYHRMEKQIIIAMLVVCLMTFSSAYYPGETISLPNEMGIENLVYTLVGNSSPVDNLIVSVDIINITITFPQDMTPDNFQIVFIERETNTVVQTVYRGGGGGGGSSRTVYKNVTQYLPEFIEKNNTIEVEKVVEVKTVEGGDVIVNEGYSYWWLVVCFIIGGIIVSGYYWTPKKSSEEEEPVQVNDEPQNTDEGRLGESGETTEDTPQV